MRRVQVSVRMTVFNSCLVRDRGLPRRISPGYLKVIAAPVRVSAGARGFAGVVEWLMAPGCKPGGLRLYEGSNPSPSIGFEMRA